MTLLDSVSDVIVCLICSKQSCLLAFVRLTEFKLQTRPLSVYSLTWQDEGFESALLLLSFLLLVLLLLFWL